MNEQHNNNSFKKIASLIGIASFSLLLGLPALAQTETNRNTCGGYEGNATTGGGYFCGVARMNNNRSTAGKYNTTNQRSTSGNALPESGRTTTGEGFPGNGQSSEGNSSSSTRIRESTTDTINQQSTDQAAPSRADENSNPTERAPTSDRFDPANNQPANGGGSSGGNQ